MNFLRNLWTRIKSFFGNLFGGKKVEAEVKAEPAPLNKAAEVFVEAYEKAEKIAFNSEWNNGTGYFDHAVEGEHAPKLAVGQIVASKSPAANNRRLIIVGTATGNAVMFERYTADANTLVSNVPDELYQSVGRPLSADDVTFLLNAGNVPVKAAA
jgi:hypothetical protein